MNKDTSPAAMTRTPASVLDIGHAAFVHNSIILHRALIDPKHNGREWRDGAIAAIYLATDYLNGVIDQNSIDEVGRDIAKYAFDICGVESPTLTKIEEANRDHPAHIIISAQELVRLIAERFQNNVAPTTTLLGLLSFMRPHLPIPISRSGRVTHVPK